MSDSRKPDVDDEAVKAMESAMESLTDDGLLESECQRLHQTTSGGFLRSFVGPKKTQEDITNLNIYKTLLTHLPTNQSRYDAAKKQYVEILGDPKASPALKEYADKLGKLIQVADERVLARQNHAKPKNN